MKNKFLPFFLGMCLTSNILFSQGICGTYQGSLEEQIHKYPHFYQSIAEKNNQLFYESKKAASKISNLKTDNDIKIIPVVVHVIHDMGNENISDASIQEAIDILNANINGQAANFLNKTPDIFAAVRGDAKVEFRLAKKDPAGNPTTGINRVRSTLTNQPEPRDAVKSLSYWNSYQYFNIWTVKQFAPQDDGNTLLGYAQFPFSGSMSTDGVVLLSSQMISGGTLTHEVGHWLGLRHTWGDAVCGDDGVKDTPVAREANFGVNLSDFPYHVGLSPPPGQSGAWGCIADSLNPAGEMFVNYMDYSSDADVTMFTKDQNIIMNETLDGKIDEASGISEIGFREYMWSDENVELTGTSDGYITPTCTQEASFVVMNGTESICLGESFLVKGNKSMFGNGNVSSFVWDFGDGTTDSSGDNFLLHDYSTTGSYDVTLTIEYSETNVARASSISDLNLTESAVLDSVKETLIVQGSLEELNVLGAENISLHIDEDGYSIDSYWKKNQFSTGSLSGAFNIDTFNVHHYEDTIVIYISDSLQAPDSILTDIINGDSLYVYIDGDNLTAQDLVVLQTPENSAADSSEIFIPLDHIIDYLDTIVEYNFYYDTTILNILTYIDSTYLTAADSSILNDADSVWSVDGVLNTADSVKIYFAQFNNDTTISISVNIDTTSLSPSDALMFNDADSSWTDSLFIGWVDTVRTYYGLHYYTKYNGYFADTLFYRGELEKVTYTATYSNTCISSVTRENFVQVSSTTASSNASSYSYSFENENDLSDDWVLNESSNFESDWSFNSGNNTTWEWTDRVAKEGDASIIVSSDNMLVGISTDIVSKAYDLSGYDSPAIKFSWSGASFNSSPVNELVISYSDNCGKTWLSLGNIGGVETSNAGLYTTDFVPDSTEWRDSVMTKSQLKSPNIKFKFEYVVNGVANNFYLDNIMIGEEANLMISESNLNARLSVFPNPANNDNPSLVLYNIADTNIEVVLINILGAEVKNIYQGKTTSNYYKIPDGRLDLDNLDNGIYFLKVISNSNVIITEKLVVDKL